MSLLDNYHLEIVTNVQTGIKLECNGIKLE